MKRFLPIVLAGLLLIVGSGTTSAQNGFGPAPSMAYSTLLSAANLALWYRADQGVTFGGMAVPVHYAGSGPAAAQPTGTPTASAQSIEVDVTTGGSVGTALFTWKLNGTIQQSGQTTASTFVLGSTGVTWNFAAGTYVTTDVYTTVPVISSWTSIDGSATVLSQATASKMPAWIAAGLSVNGWSAGPNAAASVRFNGSTQYLDTGASGFAGLAQPFAYYAIIDWTSGSSASVFVSDTSNEYAYLSSSGTQAHTLIGAGTDTPELLQMTPSVVHLMSAVVNGASSQFPIAHQYVTFNTGSWGTRMVVGAYNSAADFFGGDIPELAMLAASPSPSTNGLVQGYFANRYALP